jgi:hypothetical protein
VSHSSAAGLIGFFLFCLVSVPAWRLVSDLSAGNFPGAFLLVTRVPTSAAISSWEKQMEQKDSFSSWVRSWYPRVLFTLIRDTTGNVIAGKDGWLFYKASVETVTQRGEVPHKEVLEENACEAIKQLQQDLNSKGVELIVVPIPNKESIYPDKLAGGAPAPRVSNRTRIFLKWLESENISYANLFEIFARERFSGKRNLYLKHDSHWTPYGAEVAAQAVANSMRRGNAAARLFSGHHYIGQNGLTKIEAPSDLWDMLKKSWRPYGLELVEARTWTRENKVPDCEMEILVLGDSFLGCYQSQNAGFADALRGKVGERIQEVVAVGSPAKAIESLSVELERLPNIKLVIWLFAERKLGLATGIEGQWMKN